MDIKKQQLKAITCKRIAGNSAIDCYSLRFHNGRRLLFIFILYCKNMFLMDKNFKEQWNQVSLSFQNIFSNTWLIRTTFNKLYSRLPEKKYLMIFSFNWWIHPFCFLCIKRSRNFYFDAFITLLINCFWLKTVFN